MPCGRRPEAHTVHVSHSCCQAAPCHADLALHPATQLHCCRSRGRAVTFKAAAVVAPQAPPPRRLVVDVCAVCAQRPAAAVPHERQHIRVLPAELKGTQLQETQQCQGCGAAPLPGSWSRAALYRREHLARVLHLRLMSSCCSIVHERPGRVSGHCLSWVPDGVLATFHGDMRHCVEETSATGRTSVMKVPSSCVPRSAMCSTMWSGSAASSCWNVLSSCSGQRRGDT